MNNSGDRKFLVRNRHKKEKLVYKIKSFIEIISLENLFLSWREFKTDKKNKIDVQEFDLNIEDNLFKLHNDLQCGHYQHSNYTSFFVCDPKLRHIHKADVRDRLLHHILTRALEPIFERNFIFDSYSSRKNKGSHRAITRFKRLAWKLSVNDTKTVWILKCDIKKYFRSIDHEILLDLTRKKVRDEKIFNLIQKIVFSFQNQTGRGVPLGNLTSQLFSNIYLNELDQFIKRELKIKNYLRYADDFIIFDNDRSRLESILGIIDDFLKGKLKLEINLAKTYFRKWHQGVDFLGYIIFPHYSILRSKTKKRMIKRIKKNNFEFLIGNLSREKVDQSRQSYLGLLSHANEHKTELRILK